MIDLGKVLEGWSNYLNKKKLSPDQNAAAEDRMKICSNCDWLKERFIFRWFRILGGERAKKKVQAGYKCSACGCPIRQKVLAFSDTCGLEKQNQTPKWFPVRFKKGVRIN